MVRGQDQPIHVNGANALTIKRALPTNGCRRLQRRETRRQLRLCRTYKKKALSRSLFKPRMARLALVFRPAERIEHAVGVIALVERARLAAEAQGGVALLNRILLTAGI